MRTKIIIAMGILSTLFGCKDQPSSETQATKGDSKYSSVMALPDGIEVIHTPSKVYAGEGGRNGHRYTWLHETSVRSTVGDLEVVEFGAFTLDRGKWILGTYTGKPFTSEDFSEWYSCPSAQLTDGVPFKDPQNWTGAEALQDSSGLWYFIGENSEGTRFKGVGQVDALAQTKSESGGRE